MPFNTTMSAQSCGCDAGANWTCEQHRRCGNVCCGYRCDKERGHDGACRSEKLDTVMSWNHDAVTQVTPEKA